MPYHLLLQSARRVEMPPSVTRSIDLRTSRSGILVLGDAHTGLAQILVPNVALPARAHCVADLLDRELELQASADHYQGSTLIHLTVNAEADV